MTRRHTPSNAQKLGRGNREHNSEVWDNDERESFPQYWYEHASSVYGVVNEMAFFTDSCFLQHDLREAVCPLRRDVLVLL